MPVEIFDYIERSLFAVLHIAAALSFSKALLAGSRIWWERRVLRVVAFVQEDVLGKSEQLISRGIGVLLQ